MMRLVLCVAILCMASCALPVAPHSIPDFGPMPPPNATAEQAQTPHGRTVCIDGGATETCYRITVTPK